MRRFEGLWMVAALLVMGSGWTYAFKSASQTVTVSGDERIVINVLKRRLYFYRNGHLSDTYPVAVGMPKTPTPRGEFVITQKAVWGDGFGTRWMRFSAPWGIYGIHGTNKPWTVGTVASHGCVRMYNRNVEALYKQVSVGTPVVIEGITPYVRLRRPLEPGQLGQDVVELQRLLRIAKVYSGSLDGTYGNALADSVKKFQTMVGLPVTGNASLETIYKLLQYTKQSHLSPGYLVKEKQTMMAGHA